MAAAASVTVRIEGRTSTLFPKKVVTLPTDPVAPVTGGAPGETCAGNSVVGAVDAATNHAWTGTWDGTNNVWVLSSILGSPSGGLGANQVWLAIVNPTFPSVVSTPCAGTLNDGDSIIVWPFCLQGATTTAAATTCFKNGPLELSGPASHVPGSPITLHVDQINMSFDSQSNPFAQFGPSDSAVVSGPDGWTYANGNTTIDPGDAQLTIAEKGPATIYTSKADRPADSMGICITDGSDGYCGTTVPPQNPFDPAAFCPYTGDNGYCGSIDKTPPVGRIAVPPQSHVYPSGGRPSKLSGTVDFDPSQTDHVDLRLMRQVTVKVKKVVKKRKVWVTKKVHGKRVRKRVIKRKYRKVTQTACYGWKDSAGDFVKLKKCDPTRASLFRADGAEVWSYQFLRALPPGTYTLDALATDGSNNTDSAMELGRNRVTFTVK